MDGAYVPLAGDEEAAAVEQRPKSLEPAKHPRVASIDIFRGLSIALMIFVDYAGSIFPSVAHSPWNGVQLADFVMPFFLFIAGVSISLVYKKVQNKWEATYRAMIRATKLFLLGVLLQGGYFHGVNSLTYGVDLEEIRWLGILQRIAIGYLVASLCKIWSPCVSWKNTEGGFLKNYTLQWFVVFILSCIYLGLLYGVYVPDWQYEVPVATGVSSQFDDAYIVKTVICGVRGNLGPGCNSAGMIDRSLLGIQHLYKKPVYRNLKECRTSDGGNPENQSSWCQAPFEPEGILSSLMASVTCIVGLHVGHILIQLKAHRDRLSHWSLFSLSMFSLGLLLNISGIPLNKSLYTVSYMLLTTATAGLTFSAIYLVVDVYGHRTLTFPLEWMGRHSLSIFILIASNVAVITIQGLYWKNPKNNLVHFVISRFVRK